MVVVMDVRLLVWTIANLPVRHHVWEAVAMAAKATVMVHVLIVA